MKTNFRKNDDKQLPSTENDNIPNQKDLTQKEFEELEKLFLALNYQVDIKWFRTRFQFEWEDVTVCLDYTKGYGYIIELEKLCDDDQKLNMLELLKIKFSNCSPKTEYQPDRFEKPLNI